MDVKNHSDTICSNCGSNYMSSGWYRTYNEDGYWYGKYHCGRCHPYYNPNTGKFLKNPRTDKRRSKHENTKCVKCGSNKTSSGWSKFYDENGNWDYKSYQCKKCYEKYDPSSSHNIIKSMAQFRNGKLDPNSSIGKGFRTVQCVTKVLGIDDCNIKLDNFGVKIDACHEKYKRIEVKSSSYHLIERYWHAGKIRRNFDTLFILCMDNNFKNVERVYIMSKKDVGNVSNIGIYKNPSRCSRFDQFRIDEKPYQEAFKSMSIENCKYLRKSDSKY